MAKNVIFSDTSQINPTNLQKLKSKIDDYLNIETIIVGSSSDSTNLKFKNDLDLQIDVDIVISKLNAIDQKDARKLLSNSLQSVGFQTKQSGINIFVRVPLGDTYHQVDLEVIKNAGKISRYHQHKIPPGSPYKGVHKQLLIYNLAKTKGYFFSAWEGLFTRTQDNKKGVIVTNDWDQIAICLLGQDKSGENLDSVEMILDSLPKSISESLLSICKQDKNWI